MLIMTRPTSPSIWLATLIARFTAKTGYPITHGRVTYIKADGVAVHQETELSLQPGAQESPEAFSWRVWREAENGDAIEYRYRDGKVSGATITRRSAIPTRKQPGETMSDYVARVRSHKDTIPRA